MANYLLVYHGGGAPATEEEGAQVMAAWVAWFGSLGESVVDAGNPVGQAATIAADGATSAGGGANPVTGYSVITADSLDLATAAAKGCPHLASGGSVEVCETFAVM